MTRTFRLHLTSLDAEGGGVDLDQRIEVEDELLPPIVALISDTMASAPAGLLRMEPWPEAPTSIVTALDPTTIAIGCGASRVAVFISCRDRMVSARVALSPEEALRFSDALAARAATALALAREAQR